MRDMSRLTKKLKEEGFKFRDVKLFVIACEGAVREFHYFDALAETQTRLKINILPADDNRSAPKYVIERATKYVESFKLEGDDELWLVLDTDDWGEEELRAVEKVCEDHGWNLAISNPCFELWLYLHYADMPANPPANCKGWKTLLGTVTPGGYSVRTAIPLIGDAIRRAEALEQDPNNLVPGLLQSRLYKLAKALAPFRA
jgi:hypothetical protein